jgi:isopentenyl-diphosphate Delta-isomerase
MYRSEVILVDEENRETGVMEKLEAHQKGLLHRAFSVFILNEKGEMLLQKRALQKYHSGGLWSNACCSHPAPRETTAAAASRRLEEEMGFTCELQEMDNILYRVEFENGLTEHEYDHLFLGYYDGKIAVNPEEVSEHKYVSIEEIDRQLEENKEQFSFWFQIAYPLIKTHLSLKL